MSGTASHAIGGEVKSDTENRSSSVALMGIDFFRKHLSGADGHRCPMTPSCSTYARDAFKRHGSFMGWIMTCDRLLRCGGSELQQSNPVWVNGARRWYDPIENNELNGH